MTTTYTPNVSLTLPERLATTWDVPLNDNFEKLDFGFTSPLSRSGTTISIANASVSAKGVAQFTAGHFSVTAGVVALPDTGVTAASYTNAALTIDAQGRVTAASSGVGGGTGAPETAQYLTLATDVTLTAERVLTAGTGMSFADGGAGSTLTVNLANTAVTPGTYAAADITVDAQGRLTAASTGVGGAPIAASYLTLATHASLSAERVLTAGTNIGFTDAGANGALTVRVVASPLVDGLRVNVSGVSGAASQLSLDQFQASESRIMAWGPDASTNGIVSLRSIRSDGTNQIALLQSTTGGHLGTADRLGVGTVNPAFRLHVDGSSGIGLFGSTSIPNIQIDPSGTSDQAIGNPYLLVRPVYSQTVRRGVFVKADNTLGSFDTMTSGTANFGGYNLWLGSAESNAVPSGKKGNLSGYEASIFTAQAAADQSEGHVFGCSVGMYGGAYVNFMNATATIKSTATVASWKGLNLHVASNSASTTGYHIYLQSTGSQALAAGLKFDPVASGWTYGIDMSTATIGTALYLAHGHNIAWAGAGQGQLRADDLRVYNQTASNLALQVDTASPSAENSTLLIQTNHGGSVAVRRVAVGAAGSGGTGYRVLRVAN